MSIIGVVPLGAIDGTVLARIGEGLERTFPYPVEILPAREDPAFAFDERRGQYSSVLILRTLIGQVQPQMVRLMGVTARDLFIPMLSFVLGQAQLNGTVALVSLARLEQRFYGFPPDPELLVARAVKEAVHEVGHTFGLTHCADPGCPMSLANTVQHVDTKGATLCAACVSMLHEQLTLMQRRTGTPGAAGH